MRRVIILHRPKLNSHIHFFQTFVNELNSFCPGYAYLMHFRFLFSNSQGEKDYLKRNNKIFKFVFRPLSILNFLIHYNKTGGGVIFLKKYYPKELFYFIRFFSKIDLVTDLEGSYVHEMDYLEQRNSKGQYSKSIEGLKNVKKILKHRKSFKTIYTVTKPLTEHYSSIYPDYQNFKTLNILSPDEKMFSFDSVLRMKRREELALSDSDILITYIGNVFYPWQNISDTLSLLANLQEINPEIQCLFLIREADHGIFKTHVKAHALNFKMMSVKHEDMPSYLSASDFGITLRKNHSMNNLVLSGKLLEYSANGLPTILTESTYMLPKALLSEGLAYNVNLDNVNYSDLNDWIIRTKRIAPSTVISKFSVQANAQIFINDLS